MTPAEHKARHVYLHKCFDELAADFMEDTHKLPSKTPIMDLMSWSYEQTKNPSHPPSSDPPPLYKLVGHWFLRWLRGLGNHFVKPKVL